MYRDRDTFEQYITMADTDVKIRGRPGYPDPEITGSQVSTIIFFGPSASVWSNIKGKAHPLGPPLNCTPLRIRYSTWSKHSGKRHDRKQEKHCHFSFL